nr:putative ribonuclease H-like domain-containing protein [Tanacetum cinerariifolium]
MFDLDYLTNSMNYEHVSLENQANKSTGPQEANNSAGTQANDDQCANSEEIDLDDEHFILHVWFAYSTSVKSPRDKIGKNAKPVNQVEQIFQEELEKLKRQEKEANDAARKEATHETQDVNTNITNLLNVVSTPVSVVGPSRALNDDEPSYPDDPSMPHLEDIFATLMEPKKISQALEDESWVDVMQEELLQFQIQKSAFLYGTIDEEVYVTQPLGFIDPKFPNKVYKVVKALYGLHQAPRYCVKTASTPIETQKPLVKDKEVADVDVHLYRLLPRLHTFKLLRGSSDISKNQLLDYGFNLMNTKIYIDNESTICIVKNPVFHFKTKYIEIQHYFIRDAYERKLIQVLKIHTDDNVADILTKAFDGRLLEVTTAKQRLLLSSI